MKWIISIISRADALLGSKTPRVGGRRGIHYGFKAATRAGFYVCAAYLLDAVRQIPRVWNPVIGPNAVIF